ncbi:MAG: hypothetical protein LUE27_07810 [Clostridia bacterium]|nr:hypothetical protein [Clostridia bacterium]
MAKKKKAQVQAEEEKKEFNYSDAGFYFCAEVVNIYGQVDYRQSIDVLMDQFVQSAVDAGQHITSFVTIPESLRTPAAQKCIEYMDKTMYLAFLLVKLGVVRQRDIEDLVDLARAVKRNLLLYLQDLPGAPVVLMEEDEDGFYDTVDLSTIPKYQTLPVPEPAPVPNPAPDYAAAAADASNAPKA